VFILAFDTSSFAGSVALLDAGQVVAACALDPARRSAQTLAPAMAEVLAAAGIKPADVRLVATTIGPGSFTGVRVAATAAKTFAYAAKCDVIGLSTLDVIAAQVPLPSLPADAPPELHAVIDAQRKELFLARYRLGPDGPERLAPDTIVAAQTWLDSLAPRIIVTGPGLDKLAAHLPPHAIVIPPPLREPAAANVGQLAWRDYQLGRRDDLWKLAPTYLRPSYAEEAKSRAAGEREA
jgi:tRNA threonylcarbamoyladenosine biosynthesis protein TsaB